MLAIGTGNGDSLVANTRLFFLGFINFELDMSSVWCSLRVTLLCHNKHKTCVQCMDFTISAVE